MARAPAEIRVSGATIPIREADGAADIGAARELFEEYARWLAVDLCFQNFAEELATLPGAYARPRGRLLLAGPAPQAVGCIALRPLDAHAGEVKRLYVRPEARGTGLGARLASAVLEAAREIGYRELKLDTLARMTEARALYARLGFTECAPYYRNPLGDVIYMSMLL
jgi:GNAT superfamily N-acetyltransferase